MAWRRLPEVRRAWIAGVVVSPAVAAAAAPYAAPMVRYAAGMGQVVKPTIAAAHSGSAVKENAALHLRSAARTRELAKPSIAAAHSRSAVMEHAAPMVGYAAAASAAEQARPQAVPVMAPDVRVEAGSLQAIARAPVTR